MANERFEPGNAGDDGWGRGFSESEERRVPIIAVGGVLLVSIQSSLTDGEVRRLRTDVGQRLSQGHWKGLVIDTNGVDTMDSFITRSLRDLAVGARLMGVETVVCGLRPDVVDALVEMGLDLVGVQTTTNLDRALARLKASRRGLPEWLNLSQGVVKTRSLPASSRCCASIYPS